MARIRRRKGEAGPSGGPTSVPPKLQGPGVARSAVVEKAEARGRRGQRVDQIRSLTSLESNRDRLANLQRKVGITRVGQVAIAGAVGAYLLGRIIAGTSMLILAYGAFLLVVLAFFLAPRNLKLVADRTGLYPRVTEGDRLDVEVVLTANKRMSTFILEERLPERLGQTVKVPITKLSSGAAYEHTYSLRCARRGVYQVGPLVAVAGDPLGMCQRETIVAEPFELLVHPSLELVSDRPLTRAYEDPPIRPPVSRPWPSGMEFYGMREYRPGDEPRNIVWRASARTGKVMVREAEQGITDHITIILDTDRGGHSREEMGASESFEAGVKLCASLGVRHLREGYEVKVETNGGPLARPMRGALAQIQLLDSLARIEMDREPLTKTIMRILSKSGRDAHNVLITPRLDATNAAQLKLLMNTGVSVLVCALLWDEEHAGTMGLAASMGCQVVGVRPGQDLASALAVMA